MIPQEDASDYHTFFFFSHRPIKAQVKRPKGLRRKYDDVFDDSLISKTDLIIIEEVE